MLSVLFIASQSYYVILSTSSNNSRGKARIPDNIAHEFELIVSDLVESRGHSFVSFMRAIRARFNNPGNYFSVRLINIS